MPNCLERHSLCTEANWGVPTQHFQKGIIVWVSIKNIKNKKKKTYCRCILYILTRYHITIWVFFYFEIFIGYVLTNVQITFLTKKSKNIYRISRKIFWVRFDQMFGYVLVDWVRFDQKSGYVLTKIGYVLVGYVLAWVRFDHNPW